MSTFFTMFLKYNGLDIFRKHLLDIHKTLSNMVTGNNDVHMYMISSHILYLLFTQIKKGRKGTMLPAINIPARDDTPTGEDFKAHSLWLTRERTENDASSYPKKSKEIPQRSAYVQLGLLSQGDIFVSMIYFF